MLKTIVTTIAVLAALAGAALVPVWQVPEIQQDPIAVLVSTFLPFLSAIIIGDIIFNILSGVMRQGDVTTGSSVLYWLDYFGSVIRSISWTLVLVWVLLATFGGADGYASISGVADVPTSLWVLIGITIFSWFDVKFLQGGKHTALREHFRTNAAIAPPAPVAPVAPAPAPAAAPAPLPGAAPAPGAAPTPAAAPAPGAAPAPAAAAAPAATTTTVAQPAHTGIAVFALAIIAILAVLFALFRNGDKVKLSDVLDGARNRMATSAMCDSMTRSVTETGGGTRTYHTGC